MTKFVYIKQDGTMIPETKANNPSSCLHKYCAFLGSGAKPNYVTALYWLGVCGDRIMPFSDQNCQSIDFDYIKKLESSK